MDQFRVVLCDLTYPSPAENLACDEALLEQCEQTGTELLRFWEPSDYFVVVGYANKVETEVNRSFCYENAIPVLRRCTGGGTVLQGPGCLNYSLILQHTNCPALNTIPGTNAYILDRHCRALEQLMSQAVLREGQTDLAIQGVKFSGNAQRRRKDCLLFHGTFLLSFDLAMVSRALPMPSQQPEYRKNRPHAEFLTNLGIPSDTVKQGLSALWLAEQPLDHVPTNRVRELVTDKYGAAHWNLKF